MDKIKFSLSVGYRISNAGVKPFSNSFHWEYPSREECNVLLDQLGITDDMDIYMMMSQLEQLPIPDGCEAVKTSLSLKLPGSTGCVGRLHKNVNIEYFKDFNPNEE